MASKNQSLTLVIHGTTPNTLPMHKLADYLRILADLYGNWDDITFAKIGSGSAKLAPKMSKARADQVKADLIAVSKGIGPKCQLEALAELDQTLTRDGFTARLPVKRGVVLEFPKVNRIAAGIIGPITQDDSIQGIILKVGGYDETVPVHIEDANRDRHICTTNRGVASELGKHLFKETVRLYGEATWFRYASGEWKMDKFRVRSFDVLDDTSLREIFDYRIQAEIQELASH